MPRMLYPEESSIFPVHVPANSNEVQMRVSFKLVRNSAVHLDTLTPSGKSVPLVVRLDRNDFVRSSTAWISCGENLFSCDITVGMNVGMAMVCRMVVRLCELNERDVA
jgi:hypothetical protein